MRIGEYNKEKKKESFLSWYLLAGIFGVVLFFFFLISTKVFIFTFKFALSHWIGFTVGVLLLLIFIKKLKKPKVIKEVETNEYQH